MNGDMKDYTIYCTKEQTERAYKLGAPIESGNDIVIHNPTDDTNCLYSIPTVEQMRGWLMFEHNIRVETGTADNYLFYVVRNATPNNQPIIKQEIFEDLSEGLKEIYELTIHNGIDAALDHLEKKGKQS